MRGSLLRACLCCIAFSLPSLSGASPGVDICQDPAKQSSLSAAVHDNVASSFERNLGETDRNDFATDALFTSGGPWAFGGGHRSAILNLDSLEPQTNGDLHTFFVVAHRVSRHENRGFRFSIAPLLSGSSNVTKDPDEYTSDAVQLLAALVWDRSLSNRLGLRLGICGDHRFGDYRVYPVIGVNWQPHPDWMLALGFPRSALRYEITERVSSTLRIAPNGNEWFVKDKSLDKYSRFVYRAYLFEWAIDWRAHDDLVLTASVGTEFHRRYEMTLVDDSRVRIAGESGARLGVGLAWLF